MRRALLAALLFAQAVPAHAAVFGRNRMHLISPRFERRLKAPTRANLKRTLRLGGGTAVVVSVHGNRALLLTNEHVVAGKPAGVPAVFFDGDKQIASAPAGRVLAQNEMLDYALVELDTSSLPAGLIGAPARLRGTAVKQGEQLYKIGFPALRLLETPAYGGFDWTAADKQRQFGKQPVRTVIATGHEIGGGQVRLFHDPDPRPGHRAAVPRWSIAIDDSSLPGNSGSPVFSARTHEVVALHWAGGTSRPASDPQLRSGNRWDSANYAVPTSHVLADLGSKLSAGQLPADVHGEVKALLNASGHPPAK